METKCDIIHDLMPLYCESVCSEDSKQAVETHMQECERCRNALLQMQKESMEQVRAIDEQKVAQTAKKAWTKKKRIAFMVGCIAVVLIFSVILGVGFAYHASNSVDANDYEAIAKHAQEFYDCGELTVKKVEINGNYLAALCINDSGEWLMYKFERDALLRDRWVVSGGTMGIQEGFVFGSFNYGSPRGEAVIIIFGGDIPDEVSAYQFNNGGTTYKVSVESDMVLDIYVLKDHYDINGIPVALDENGEEIYFY